MRGIGISGQQHGFVPLDEKGEVIRPAKLWCDTSTTAECAILTKKLGGEKAAIRKAGLAFLPGFTAPKILWLKRNEPSHYRRLRHVLLPHDYLNFHLTGNYFMEYGDASGTALMDVRKRTWSSAVINALDKNLADWLPPLSPSHADRMARHRFPSFRNPDGWIFGCQRTPAASRPVLRSLHQNREWGPRYDGSKLDQTRRDGDP